jgi:NADPH-dependent ferric siderophore reductase
MADPNADMIPAGAPASAPPSTGSPADRGPDERGRPERGREGRRRRPPRRVEVVSVSRLTPRLVSVRLGGDDLDGFAAAPPTSHLKVFLPAPGQAGPVLPEAAPDGTGTSARPDGAPEPVVRTYTPRQFDVASGTLEVQFVLHGMGPASEWAEQARAGDQLAIAGPGGRFSLEPAADRWWIGGDESALPAIGTLLEALPASATAEVHLEVAGADDEIPLASPAQTTFVWHQRRSADAWGADLLDAARNAALGDGTRVWAACEAAAVRRIRAHFLAERQVPASQLVTRGYWRIGVANHPDHDYGED